MRGVGGARAALAALGILLAVSPWLEGGASPSGLFVSHTLIFLLLALSWRWSRSTPHAGIGLGWEAPLAAALLAICMLSFLRVDYHYGSFLALWDVFMAVLLAACVMLLGGRSLTVTLAVVPLSSAAQAVALFVMPVRPNLSPSASFANANQLAAYLNVGGCLAMARSVASWRAGFRLTAVGWASIAVMNVAALVRIGSRGALAGLVLAAAVGILLSVPADRRGLRRALWGGVAGLMILGALAVAWRFERMSDPYQFDRLRIWKAGLDATVDHPLLGMGPGMFERRSYRYNFPLEREMFRYSKVPGSTHSTWLQTSTQIGLFGLGAALLLTAALLAGLYTTRRLATGPGLALVACLVQGFVDTPFEVPAVTFALIAALVPTLMPSGPRQAPFYLALAGRSRGPARGPAIAALAGATPAAATFATAIVAWLGAVLLPFIAWSEAGRGNLQAAIRLDRFNPRYHAEQAEAVWHRSGASRPAAASVAPAPPSQLTPQVLARVDQELTTAHRLDPGNPEHLLSLAQLHAHACFEIGADDAVRARAEGYYRGALALGLKDPRPHLELAAFLLALSRQADGIEQIRAALAIEPRFIAARESLVRALRQADQPALAAQEEVRLEETRRELAGYLPKNGYEQDLMRSPSAALAAPPAPPAPPAR